MSIVHALRFGLLAIALSSVTAAVALGGDDLKITRLLADEVEVYEDPTAAKVAGTLYRGEMTQALPVLEVAENLMFLVDNGKVRGWIYPFFVETNMEPGDIGPCAYAFQGGSLGVRNVGENCKKPSN
ncbi:MAG: hypothetical protein L0210_05305 [Rhodospirillales bacterium]|nr:hypothetical protein [Rhodospirillales bacterium]